MNYLKIVTSDMQKKEDELWLHMKQLSIFHNDRMFMQKKKKKIQTNKQTNHERQSCILKVFSIKCR